jgi:hypothetical protein
MKKPEPTLVSSEGGMVAVRVKGASAYIDLPEGFMPIEEVERLLKCKHEHIAIVTETPQDDVYFQEPKMYVKCMLCNEVLPIHTIEKIDIKVHVIN